MKTNTLKQYGTKIKIRKIVGQEIFSPRIRRGIEALEEWHKAAIIRLIN